MSDRTAAAIAALRAETYGAEWVPDLADIAIRTADKTDRANGVVRVDTRDEATIERVARVLTKHAVITDGIEEGFGWCPECGNVDDDNEDHQARAVLAALDTGEGEDNAE